MELPRACSLRNTGFDGFPQPGARHHMYDGIESLSQRQINGLYCLLLSYVAHHSVMEGNESCLANTALQTATPFFVSILCAARCLCTNIFFEDLIYNLHSGLENSKLIFCYQALTLSLKNNSKGSRMFFFLHLPGCSLSSKNPEMISSGSTTQRFPR